MKTPLPAAIAPFMQGDGPSPLQVLQGLMTMHLHNGNWEAAGRYAVEAAPYRHAKAVALAVQEGQGELFEVDPVTKRPVMGFRWQQGPLLEHAGQPAEPALGPLVGEVVPVQFMREQLAQKIAQAKELLAQMRTRQASGAHEDDGGAHEGDGAAQ